jgi:PIN domain nuclease of toxin-antitoxin system
VALLLDTCAAIWAAEGALEPEAVAAVNQSFQRGESLFVSPITAWEIGLLMSRGRLTSPLDPQTWFDRLLAIPGMRLAEFGPRILIASSYLPASPPRDPADRIVAATARLEGYRLLTRDKVLLDYAAEGHLDALAC